jgi:hypothetical protein
MKIKKIRAKNFGSYPELEIDFEKLGPLLSLPQSIWTRAATRLATAVEIHNSRLSIMGALRKEHRRQNHQGTGELAWRWNYAC